MTSVAPRPAEQGGQTPTESRGGHRPGHRPHRWPQHWPQYWRQHWRWPLTGVVAGVAGVLVGEAVASALTSAHSPVVAIADAVIRLSPGGISHFFIDLVGTADKPLLVIATLTVATAIFAGLGALARTRLTAAQMGFAVLALLGAVAVFTEHRATAVDMVPVALGLVVWVSAIAVVHGAASRADAEAKAETSITTGHDRRRFLAVSAGIGMASVVAHVIGRWIGHGRQLVEDARGALRLPISAPKVPAGADLGLSDPWMTPVADFYRIDTAISAPAVDPAAWRLRVHGMVEREIQLSFADLIDREVTESWMTLNCVSNEVGGDLIGNAWWSGVKIADLLAEAGIRDGADAVLQTSHDGWTCLTPLEAMTDDRGAMLAVGMNGQPLTIEHGFPVRTVVPGLYGYVSATKWVVDLEVTRFADAEGYWTSKGWSALGPTKLASRIDQPADGDTIQAGRTTIAGVAWRQGVGVESVEISIDGGPWTRATLAGTPNLDTWVQWRSAVTLEPGSHAVRVRATDRDGVTQSGVQVPPAPNGSEGWHSIVFAAI